MQQQQRILPFLLLVVLARIFSSAPVSCSLLLLQHHHDLPLKTHDTFLPHETFSISTVKAGGSFSDGTTMVLGGQYSQIYAVTFHLLDRHFRIHLTPSLTISNSLTRLHKYDHTGELEQLTLNASTTGQHFIGYVAGHAVNTNAVPQTDVIFSISSSSKSSSPHFFPVINNSSRIFATIYTADEHYYIEPLHAATSNPSDAGRHIIYRVSDVQYDHHTDDTEVNAAAAGFCGFTEHATQHQNSTRFRRQAAPTEKDTEADTNDVIIDEHAVAAAGGHSSRMAGHYFEVTKHDCPLLLVADYRFYRTIGGNDTSQTVNYLINIIERVNLLYRRTEFATERGERVRGMGFSIRGIIVHTAPETSIKELHYNMPNRKWKVKSLLETFSREAIHKYYCLSHLFTDQIFEDGILGLAYVASRTKIGGICSGSDNYQRDGQRVFLNTGLSSIRNEYGRQIITRQAELVLAHELAHNWGAQHDPDVTECSPPSRVGGKFVMYTYSVSGLEPNNRYFSPCTRNAIAQVLRDRSQKCFVPRHEAFCGNSLVERSAHEQCDGGLHSKVEDKCCDVLCQLRDGAQCSDRNDMCCRNCQFVPKSARQICGRGNLNTCQSDAYCQGDSAECPPSTAMLDGTPCLRNGKCLNGSCIPFCESLPNPQRSCQCDSLQFACVTCCQGVLTDDAECRPTESMLPLPDGTPCLRGYCRNAICERVVQSDSLSRWWLSLTKDVGDANDVNDDNDADGGTTEAHRSKSRIFWFFRRVLRDNLVGVVITLSLCAWIPLGIVVGRYDARKRANYKRDFPSVTESSLLDETPLYVSKPAADRVQRVRFVQEEEFDEIGRSDATVYDNHHQDEVFVGTQQQQT